MQSPYFPVIGLEIHAQLKTKTKLFCHCRNDSFSEPNSNICPVCMGLPGVLPVLNKNSVTMAIKVAAALKMQLNRQWSFARKLYSYPDLPKGYQVTMLQDPVASNGEIAIFRGTERIKIEISRIHLEEDAGRLIHRSDFHGRYSLVDYNRAAIPLLEMVTEPVIESPEIACELARHYMAILQYLDVCEGNLEEGHFRIDANVSVRRIPGDRTGVKTEIKNLNSFRYLVRALEFEIRRQIGLYQSGQQIIPETRLYNAKLGTTVSMRSKEFSSEYRYFAEPDLPRLEIPQTWIDECSSQIPELPLNAFDRYVTEFELSPYQAKILTDNIDLKMYFDQCCRLFEDARMICHWIIGPLMALKNKTNVRMNCDFPISPIGLTCVLKAIKEGTIIPETGKKILNRTFNEFIDPRKLLAAEIKEVKSEPVELEEIIREILDKVTEEIKRLRLDPQKLERFCVGLIMKKTGRRADPRIAIKLIRKFVNEMEI